MKKLFSKNRKFGGDGDVSAMMTQQLSYDGNMSALQEKIKNGSTVEGDYSIISWINTTNIQAALKGIVANTDDGVNDPTNTARMDIIMYLIEKKAKTDYIPGYLNTNPLDPIFLTEWIKRLVNLKGQGPLVQQLNKIKSSATKSQTPGAAVKDYTDEMNAIFVTEENKEPNAALNLLFSIAKNGTPENMKIIIEDYEQDINAENESGRTPLMVAVENGNLGVVKAVFENENIRKNLLISKGDKEGNTAFIVACNAQPVNEELVNYLTGKLDYTDLFLKNQAGETAHNILIEHKKRIDNEKANPNYNRTKTPAQMAADSAQAISYASLITTLNAIHKKKEDSAKAKVRTNVQELAQNEARKQAQAKAQAEKKATEEKKNILKTALIKYVNDNFKETYLTFIDATMRQNDKKWVSLSKTCYVMHKPNICDNVENITDLGSKKTALYSQIINYYKATSVWFSFENVVKYVVLKDIKNLTEERKTLIMNKIDDDIKKSDAELSAANRDAGLAAIASYIPFNINSKDNKKLLKDGLVKYINDKFKDKYLQFIDVEMRKHDPNWKFISSCKNYTVFSSCKTSDQLHTDKDRLYLEIVNYCNETGEWIDFKTVVNLYVLDGINPSYKTAINENVAIKKDIEDSHEVLEAKNPSLLAGVVKAFTGSSRRSKKRSASKTRKQKK
jgi:ankyrin repeat protein